MTFFRFLTSRIAAPFTARRANRRLDEELQSHFDLLVDENLSRGLSLDEARRTARLSLGGADQIKQSVRDHRAFAFLDSLAQDVRFAARTLRKSPAFTAIAILTLALGIGANTAIFSAIDCIVLKPLPYANSSELVNLEASDVGGCPTPDFFHIRSESQTLYPMALHTGPWGTTLIGAGQPQGLRFQTVSADFMPLLGIRPLLGRWFVSSETEPGNEHVAILSYSLWQDTFDSDPRILGRNIRLLTDRDHGTITSYKVVGVMPPKFDFPGNAIFGGTGVTPSRTQLWVPLAIQHEDLASRWGGMAAVARIRPGFSLQDVNTELSVISSHLDKSDPRTYKNTRYRATPLKEELVSQAQLLLSILLAIAGSVLLIACANLANLFLSRGWARRPEIAVRATLGATRRRILRQLFVECLLLSVAGGIAGFLLAFSATGVLRHLLPSNTPRLDDLRINPAALWFTLGVCVVATVLFGLVPALLVSRQDPGEVMKEGGSRSSGAFASHAGRWFRDSLVAGQVALAFVLVFSAGLGLRAFDLVAGANMGFRTDHLLAFGLPFRPNGDTLDAPQFSRSLVARLGELPGVESVAGEDAHGQPRVNPTHIEGAPDQNLRSLPSFAVDDVTPNYFTTMDIPLKLGSDFTGAETPESLLVAVVNETLARRYFGASDPIGTRITVQRLSWDHPPVAYVIQVIGEVGDTRFPSAPFRAPIPMLYLNYYQWSQIGLVDPVLRTAKDPAMVIPAVRAVLATIQSHDPVWKNDPPTTIMTMDQQMDRVAAYPRSRAILLGSFGVLGLLLAAIGIYGLISYSVLQRTHEIGVRMALGAQPPNVLRLILLQGTRPALAGIVLGFSAAWGLARFARVLIYFEAVKATDPLTFAAASALLGIVAAVACYIPARRATRVDPLTALRHE